MRTRKRLRSKIKDEEDEVYVRKKILNREREGKRIAGKTNARRR